uniref:Uncharacterized protein n=1 Tax=Romanomermis culicivorax TaxID=13658 RepID=A0A915KA87_ROMCU
MCFNGSDLDWNLEGSCGGLFANEGFSRRCKIIDLANGRANMAWVLKCAAPCFPTDYAGLTIGAAEAISLDGMTILAAEVDWLLVRASRAGVDAAFGGGRAGRASCNSDDWELARDES